ncbi:MAG: NrsF family protein [Sandaracinobacteroides sp.]
MNRNDFIDGLVLDLAPVRRISPQPMVAALAVTLAAGLLAVALVLGVRTDLLAGAPHPVAVLRSGLLLNLGILAAAAAVRAAQPARQPTGNVWQIGGAAALLFPLAGLLTAVADPVGAFNALAPASAIECLKASLACALGFGLLFTLWLRRGAPLSPERAGLAAGISAGALGTFCYSIRCPYNDPVYIGLWYGLAILISALAGRFLIARAIRW